VNADESGIKKVGRTGMRREKKDKNAERKEGTEGKDKGL